MDWGEGIKKYFSERKTVWGWTHFMLGVIHFAFGIGVWAGLSESINNTGQEIYFMQPIINKIPGETGFSIDIEEKYVGSISPILIHAVVSILTGFSHFISHGYYKEYGLCTSRPNHIRWTEYSVTATLMTFSAFVSLGEGNILFISSIMLLGVLLQGCGWLIERYCRLSETDNVVVAGRKWYLWYWFFFIGVMIELAIVIPLIVLTAKIENKKDGINESLVFYTLYYFLFAVNCFYDAHVMTQATNSEFVDSSRIDPETGKNYVLDRAFMLSDERYVVLSFTSKIALFWITIGMVMRQSVTTDESSDGWYSAIYIGMFVPLAGLIWFILYQRYNQTWFGKQFGWESITKDYQPEFPVAETALKKGLGQTVVQNIGFSHKTSRTPEPPNAPPKNATSAKKSGLYF